MTTKKLTSPQKLRLRALARDIAVDLFGYGVAERADRLVQVVGTPERALGGWSIGPATDRIQKHLVAHAEKASRRGDGHRNRSQAGQPGKSK